MRDKNSTPIEAIDFKSLHNKTKDETTQQLASARTPIPKVWFAFLFLIICGLGVFLLLPKYVDNQKTSVTEKLEPPKIIEEVTKPAPEIVEAPIEQAPKLTAEELSAYKSQAEDLLLEIIKKQDGLEQQGIKQWAKEEYLQATELGTIGDEYFRKQNYVDAIHSYENAIVALNKLEEKVTPTLAKYLELGELALTQAEQKTAVINFDLALAIDTNNEQAKNGLARAETIVELFSLLEKGGNIEAANRFEDAKKIYQQAIDLDPLSPEAKIAFNRVSTRITEQSFSHLMANGYSSLKIRQYEDARNAFKAAQTLLPNSEQPKQALAKLNQAIRQEKIKALKVEAQHFEANQEWSLAVQSYKQILALSPNNKNAKQGLQRNTERHELLLELDKYIHDEFRLSNVAVANEAQALLARINQIENPGTKITQRSDTLKLLIKRANEPVSITLRSDNETNIIVYKVGKFGKFETKQLQLKPGKYTIIGSRTGYRDIRKILTVSAEMANKTISVNCEEQI